MLLSPWLDPELPGSQGKERNQMLHVTVRAQERAGQRVQLADGGPLSIQWPLPLKAETTAATLQVSPGGHCRATSVI